MAQIIIDIPDDKVAEVRDAFAETFGWSVDLGLTKTQFAKQKIADFIKRVYREYKGATAGNAARDAAYAQVDAVIIS